MFMKDKSGFVAKSIEYCKEGCVMVHNEDVNGM